jgi:serine/threonine-protein kinase HSL1 (negative regulator of Swe1 kinase)
MENIEGGELFDHISRNGPLNEREAVFLFKQLLEALLYCHRLQIFHRDLKPENILIQKDTMAIKLIDFGMAAYQPIGELLQTPCGSPHYAAPELLHGIPYDGSKADVWSLGVVLFVMLTNEPPFNWSRNGTEENKLRSLYEQIKGCKVKIPSHLSSEAKEMFRRIFVADPARRIDIMELWELPIIHKYDRDFKYEGRPVEDWIGPSPTLENWIALTPKTIDTQILRNLRTLWHDDDEASLVRRLCCPQ